MSENSLPGGMLRLPSPRDQLKAMANRMNRSLRDQQKGHQVLVPTLADFAFLCAYVLDLTAHVEANDRSVDLGPL